VSRQISAGRNAQIRSYQTASVGWHPTQKRKELYHRESRFLLVGNDTLVAFSMFRFEREDDVDLIYCYELQVAPEAQRQGLGRKIVDALVRIGKAYNMEKIVLTVFLGLCLSFGPTRCSCFCSQR